jgi:uncharacterized membrane protein YedE/YeeE
MDVVSILRALAGGTLIGAAASLYLLFRGAPVGISGMVEDALNPRSGDRRDALWFLAGLFAAGLIATLVSPSLRATAPVASIPVLVIAGLLVGFGTRLGSGCTSGHGVCGLSRFSWRSLVATFTFMFVAGLVTYLVTTVSGSAS